MEITKDISEKALKIIQRMYLRRKELQTQLREQEKFVEGLLHRLTEKNRMVKALEAEVLRLSIPPEKRIVPEVPVAGCDCIGEHVDDCPWANL